VAEVAAANGVRVFLCDQPAPTPVISYNVLSRRTGGAVIITASHNPAIWSGFKYKPEYAGSASPDITSEIEERVVAIERNAHVSTMLLNEAMAQGLAEEIDPRRDYLPHIRRLMDTESLQGAALDVVVDAMFGAGGGYFPALLHGGTLRLHEIKAERNPAFPGIERPEPIAANLGDLSRLVKESGASVGLANDADADRLGVVDENGVFLTQLQVFALLALYMLEVRGERGPLVKSVTTTSMIFRLGELYGVPVYEMPVGFKYIGPKMVEVDALIGGEESGGYGFRGHIPERDGILAGLYFLDFMAKTGKTPSQLLQYLYAKVGPHYYDRIDMEFPQEARADILARVAARLPERLDGSTIRDVDRSDGFRFLLTDGSWLLIRFSGTEPIMRIYAETDTPERVQRLLAAGRGLAGL
jgi:phosphomannomutase